MDAMINSLPTAAGATLLCVGSYNYYGGTELTLATCA
jgi:hypothetical protein